MSNNKNLLQTLEQILNQVNPELLKRLASGISTSEIDEVAESVQVNFPQGVYDLYTWRNGVEESQSAESAELLMFPNGIQLSLDEAAAKFKKLSLNQHIFEPNYFPLFTDGDNNFLLIDMDASDGVSSMISLYSPALLRSGNPVSIYDSFSSLLETVISCYNQKAFWIEENKLQVDADAHYNIASAINPNSQYWQYM